MKTRIEINDVGDFYTIIPDDVIDAYNFDEGDTLEWDMDDKEFVILSLI